MEIILNDGTKIQTNKLSTGMWRELMAEVLRTSPSSSQIWDLMSCIRGPDTPSERPDMTPDEYDRTYDARRKRKYQTVEVIRHAVFHGVVGGSARHHADNQVKLPTKTVHDHFDRHMERGAKILGLNIKYREAK